MELQILLPLRLYHPLNTPHLPASICVLIGTLHPRKGTYKNQLSELVYTKISTTGRSPIHAASEPTGLAYVPPTSLSSWLVTTSASSSVSTLPEGRLNPHRNSRAATPAW